MFDPHENDTASKVMPMMRHHTLRNMSWIGTGLVIVFARRQWRRWFFSNLLACVALVLTLNQTGGNPQSDDPAVFNQPHHWSPTLLSWPLMAFLAINFTYGFVHCVHVTRQQNRAGGPTYAEASHAAQLTGKYIPDPEYVEPEPEPVPLTEPPKGRRVTGPRKPSSIEDHGTFIIKDRRTDS